MLFSRFDKVIVIFAVLILGTVIVSAGVLNTSKPTHPLSQIGVNGNTIADNNIILPAYGGTGIGGCTGDGNILYWNNTSKTWMCGSNVNISGAPTGASLSGGVANTITKWLTATTIGNSIITDNGTTIALGGTTPAIKLILEQNNAIKIGSAYLSSGGDYAHLASNWWFSGSCWMGATGCNSGVAGAIIQLSGMYTNFYTMSATGTPTLNVQIDDAGRLKALKGFVVENRSADPTSPLTGQMWIITP